jgi:hypothetical protein
MWEIESDRFTTDRLLCLLCGDQNFKVILPCNKHTICKKCVQKPTITKKFSNKRHPEIEVICPYCRCVGKGECAENMEANDLLEFYRGLRAKGGKECSLHVLHERLYSCRTCDNKELFCLMCFAEKHMGHIIFKSECITEDHLLNSSHTTSTVKPVFDHKCTPPTSDDDDDTCDDDEDYREKEIGSKGKKRKAADHSVQIDSTRFSERDNTEEGDELCKDIYSEKSRESKNRGRKELERLAPKKSKKVKMEDWMNHYYALLSYGDEHKDSKGKANYNVPKGYVYGTGEDEVALGDFVSNLNFKKLAKEKEDLLLPLITEGDFSILFGENEADNCNTKCINNTKDDSLDNHSCPADINTDSKALIQQPQKGVGRKQKQERQQPPHLQQEDNQRQQHSHRNQRINHDQQSLLQAVFSSSSHSSRVHDGYYYNNNSSSNNDNNVTNNDNYHDDNVTLWKGRPPLPAELELKSCILYIHREPDNEREYIRWGQIKDFDSDINGCSNDTKILTRYVQPSDIDNMEKCSYTIYHDTAYFAMYKDILLWGLTLKEGKHSTAKKWCTTDDSKTKVAEFLRNNQRSKLTFKDD